MTRLLRLALQHRVALLKARTLQHQQVIAEMRRREHELEVSILRRQLAQLREQVSDRCDMFPAALTHASHVTQGVRGGQRETGDAQEHEPKVTCDV